MCERDSQVQTLQGLDIGKKKERKKRALKKNPKEAHAWERKADAHEHIPMEP